jgi:anti-anti-sigma regulatory factor
LRTKRRRHLEVPQFAEKLWSIASRHFIYRLVLELDELDEMPRGMTGQLVLLQERLAQCGGALRICGLSPECEETLQSYQLDTVLQNHATREEAVLGSGEYAVARR